MKFKSFSYDMDAPKVLHHVGIVTTDLPTSLRFYQEGIGLSVLLRGDFEGPFRRLFDSRSDALHSVFLGDPRFPHQAIVELVHFRGVDYDPLPNIHPAYWLSFWVDVDDTLARLERLGLANQAVAVSLDGARVATVLDPMGVRVELISNSVIFDEN